MIRILPLAIVLWFGTTSAAHAHRLFVRATPLAATLRIEAWFEGDLPAESAKIALVDSRGTSIDAGFTDDTGILTLALPPAGIWTISAESIGHRGECSATIPEISPSIDPPIEPRPSGPEWWRIAAGPAIVALLFAGLRLRLRRERPGRSPRNGRFSRKGLQSPPQSYDNLP